MYRIIESKIAYLGLSKKQLALSLGIKYNTLLLKLSGKSTFSLDEALKIKDFLKAEEPVEELFKKTA